MGLVGENGTSSIALTYATNQWTAQVEPWGTEGIVRADLESQAVVESDRRDLKSRIVGWSSLEEALQTLGSTASGVLRGGGTDS